MPPHSCIRIYMQSRPQGGFYWYGSSRGFDLKWDSSSVILNSSCILEHSGVSVKSLFPFLHCCWECKVVQPLWKTVQRFFRKLKGKSAYDPIIPFLGIYLDKTVIQKRYIWLRYHPCCFQHQGRYRSKFCLERFLRRKLFKIFSSKNSQSWR